jgi:hypothetical protein
MESANMVHQKLIEKRIGDNNEAPGKTAGG